MCLPQIDSVRKASSHELQKKDNTLRMTSCKGRLFNLEVAADRKQIAPHTCIAGLQKTENGSGCRRKTWKLDRKLMGLVCKSASQQIEKE